MTLGCSYCGICYCIRYKKKIKKKWVETNHSNVQQTITFTIPLIKMNYCKLSFIFRGRDNLYTVGNILPTRRYLECCIIERTNNDIQHTTQTDRATPTH